MIRVRQMSLTREFVAEFWFPTLLFLFAVLFIQPFGNFPLNDDWVYARNALQTAELGHYHSFGNELAWGIPQVLFGSLLVKLFGFSHGLFRCVGIVSIIAAIGGIYYVIRKCNTSSLQRLLIIATCFFYPPLFVTGISFMTDGPFMALWIWAGIFLEQAWSRRSVGLLVIAMLLSAAALIQRQFGLLLPMVGILLVSIACLRKRKVEPFEAYFLLSCSTCFVLYLGVSRWWGTLPNSQVLQYSPPSSLLEALKALRDVLPPLYRAFIYLGFVYLPFLLLSGGTHILHQLKRLKNSWIGRVGLVFILYVSIQCTKDITHGKLMPFYGNLISKFGIFKLGETMAGERPIVLSTDVRFFLTIVGSLSAIALLIAVFDRLAEILSNLDEQLRKSGNLIFILAIGYLVLVSHVTHAQFDRYVFPAIPAVAILMAVHLEKLAWSKVAVSTTCILLLAGCSIVLLHDFMRWNEARWEAGRWAVKQGISPSEISGGYEWDGWHRPLRKMGRVPSPGKLDFFGGWSVFLENQPSRALISHSPIKGLRVWKTFSYPNWAAGRTSTIFLLADTEDNRP